MVSPVRSRSPPGAYSSEHSGVERKIGSSTSNRKACIGTTSTPSRAARAGPAVRSPSRAVPKRSSAAASPSVVPYAPQDEGPTLKRWIAFSEKRTSIGMRAAGSAPSRPRPGAATKKSSRWSSPPAVWTSMNPPAPGPVSGDSATKDISTQATAASTALPPPRSTSAPARAVTGWPAATTPFTQRKLARDELRHVDVGEGGAALALPAAPHPRLVVRRDARLASVSPRRGPVLRPVAVAGRHHRDPDLVLDLLVDHGPEDDVRLGVARLGHDRPDIGEVEVDQARERDQVGDALDALAQHVVRHAERLHHRGRLVQHRQQARVRDHDQRVDLAGELLDPQVGLLAAPRPLEGERLGDDAHRERAHLAGDARDDRRRARAGAAACAGGDEHHVRAAQHGLHLVVVLERREAPELGVRARAEPARGFPAYVHAVVRRGLLERLGVGVDRDELDALDLRLDHPVDGVHARASHPDDAQDGLRDLAGRRHGVRRRQRLGRAGRLELALHDVLGGVRREHGAQALLRARDAVVAAVRLVLGLPLAAAGALVGALLCALGGLGQLHAAAGLAGLRLRPALGPAARDLRRRSALGQRPSATRLLRARLAAARLLARAARLLAGLLALRAAARLLLLPLRFVLLRLAEELGQRPLAHARPLTACHSPGPPPLADGRRRPPCRPGRTSAPTSPSPEPPRNAPSC